MAPLYKTRTRPVEARLCRKRISFVLGLLAVTAGLASPVLALDDQPYPAQITPPPSHLDLPTTLVVDEQVPPTNVAQWRASLYVNRNEELRLRAKRQDDEDEEESTTTTRSTDRTTTTTDETETGTGDGDEEEDGPRSTQTISEDLDSLTTFTVSLAPSPTASGSPEDSPLPIAFDDTPKSEFQGQGEDDSCPNFMQNLLNSQTYLDCYPLSTMVETSTSLFNAKRQLTSTVRVLETSCAADVNACADFMSETARNLTREENCEAEFNSGLKIVMQAYRGLRTYELVYSVSCLQDPETDMYCYANAVTSLLNPSDANLYVLPYGQSLPGSSTPSCDWCNQETMAIYNAASADRDQDIANTYEDAARQVNAICGPNFVNGTLPEAVESMARATTPVWLALVMTLCLGLVGNLVF